MSPQNSQESTKQHSATMDYKTYKIYDCEELSDFTECIKIAQCMKSDTYNYSSRQDASREALARLEELTVSEKLLCSFCNTSFEDQQQQRLHYKLDWHRYNLKQHLGGLGPVSEDNFAQVAGTCRKTYYIKSLT
uniref:C2H2-type domain-containing protein n=2 Tax=Timema TaxID=61471 RepID=A0A7R9JXI4_TIMGE|nr:unnamed protein product [Timema genevievae]